MRNSKNIVSDISVSPLKYFKDRKDVQHLFSDKKMRCRPNQGSCSPFTKNQQNLGAKQRIQSQYFQDHPQGARSLNKDQPASSNSNRHCPPLIQKHFQQMNVNEAKLSSNRVKHFQKLDGQSQPQNYCRSIGRVSKLLNKQSYSQSYVSKEKSQCSSASTANTIMITDFKKDDSLDFQMTTRNKRSKQVGKKRANNSGDQLNQQDNHKYQKREVQEEQPSQENLCSQLDQTACWGTPGSIMDISNSQENQLESAKPIIAIPTTRAHTQQIVKSTLTRSSTKYYSHNKSKITPSRNRSTKLGKSLNSVKKLEQDKETMKIMIEKPKLPFAILTLVNKKQGSKHKYKVYKEQELEFLRATNGKKLVLDFNMKKLELEYDYDTDEEQILAAKQMLSRENIDAVDYFVKEDPLILVGNLNTD